MPALISVSARFEAKLRASVTRTQVADYYKRKLLDVGVKVTSLEATNASLAAELEDARRLNARLKERLCVLHTQREQSAGIDKNSKATTALRKLAARVHPDKGEVLTRLEFSQLVNSALDEARA